MLGSHNSLTYLSPKTLWGKILSPWTKCQDKDLIRQYNNGARYFDIRVRFNKDGNPVAVHNKVEYRGDVYHILELLNEYIQVNGFNKAYLRLILDIRNKSDFEENQLLRQRLLFVEFCHNAINLYDNLVVASAITYWNWQSIMSYIAVYKDIQLPTTPELDYRGLIEIHASVTAKWYEYLLGTKWYADSIRRLYDADNIRGLYDSYKNRESIYLVDYI